MNPSLSENLTLERSWQDTSEETVLRQILEGTAGETGKSFFAALVENLAKALETYGAWVTIWHGEQRLRAVAFWLGNRLVPDYEYNLAGTPCEPVFKDCRLIHVPNRVVELYPNDPDLVPMGAVSYMGVPLLDVDGKILGHLAVLDTRPMPQDARLLALFHIFAARAAAELQRLRAEQELAIREERLRLLFDSAMDVVVEIDQKLVITRVNPAAQKAFHRTSMEMVGENFRQFIKPHSLERLMGLMRELDTESKRHCSLWIPGILEAMAADGMTFPAESTLSRFEIQGRVFYTLILRNVNDQIEAERKIHFLSAEADYLRDTLKSLGGFDQIVGDSAALTEVLRDVNRVAVTDATVLIFGETGTGKELIARAIHGASQRLDKPLITVNCAAIPTALMESEFFGHEKGAFTGASQKREGCFALADGGTIFLDEIGELSLELQAKLLRVLQEGEFTPVGAEQLQKVNVRVLAATNRDLKAAMRLGQFREDLYYRLNVFPIHLPSLRERAEDIPLLADEFAAKCCRRMGKVLRPMSQKDHQRLMAYAWPGNVRELQNVIERAVITAQEGRLNFDRALPLSDSTAVEASVNGTDQPLPEILTLQELEELERQNILRALDATNQRVAGRDGAAALLGMKPSTLSSRIKALNIQR